MACFRPWDAYQSKALRPNGKRFVKFSPWLTCRDWPKYYEPCKIPCGQCIGCRVDRSRSWALRCLHEASLYDSRNSFLTLTFRDERLNALGSLDKTIFPKFMKRLREKFVPKCPHARGTPEYQAWTQEHGIRFFHCAEYGEKFFRPHHHCLLFNFRFPDEVMWKMEGGQPLYRSRILEDLWIDTEGEFLKPINEMSAQHPQSYGHSVIGAVTYDSAAYVARYCVKKINGPLGPAHYQGREPEFITMSRDPGIGRGWYEKFYSDVYPADRVVVKGGFAHRPPKYYDRIYELTNPDEFMKIKAARMESAKSSPDNTRERLRVREDCLRRRLKQKKRRFEDGS